MTSVFDLSRKTDLSCPRKRNISNDTQMGFLDMLGMTKEDRFLAFSRNVFRDEIFFEKFFKTY